MKWCGCYSVFRHFLYFYYCCRDEDEKETDQLEERANRNKRKKIIVKRQKKKSESKLHRILNKAEEVLKNCNTTEIYDNFDGLWEEINNDIGRMMYRDVTKVDVSYSFPTNNEIWCLETEEKLCNYKDLFIDYTSELHQHVKNAVANPLSNINIIDRIGSNMNAFCARLANHSSFSGDLCEPGSRCCSVNLKPLPGELISEYLNNNVIRVGQIIKDLLHPTVCRRPSETDSLCHEAHLEDVDDGIDRVASQRTIDSGFGSCFDSTQSTFNEDEIIIIDDEFDCHEEVVDDGIDCGDDADLQIPKEEPTDTFDTPVAESTRIDIEADLPVTDPSTVELASAEAENASKMENNTDNVDVSFQL